MMEKIAGLFEWLGLVGAVSAFFAFLLFYGLIHYLSKWSWRYLDRIRKDPVPLIVGLCAAILTFYFVEQHRLLTNGDVHEEVVKSIVQFLLLIILGGAVTAIYQARLREREDAERQRAERVTITEHDRQVLTVMRDNLISAYHRVKRVRRLLRARLEYPEGKTGPRFVPKLEYDEQMEQVIDALLEFESILRQIYGNVPLFGKDSGLGGCLDDIEKHLKGTVKEYREKLWKFDGNPPRMNLEELPKLQLFLGLETRDDASESPPDVGAKHRFKEQFKTAIRYLQKEINKLTRRINRTGSVLWVDDKPQNNSYEISWLEDNGYEVTKVPSTDEAKEFLKGLKPMLIISNMSRIEKGELNPEAGLELLKEVGESNDVYIYTSYGTVSKYQEKVQPLAKGITNSRLTLLKSIDECAEEVEKIDQPTPTKEKTVP